MPNTITVLVPKGNKFLRRILTQAAQAAVKKKGSHFQIVFRRWMPKLGHQAAIWAIAHKLARVLRAMGYQVAISSLNLQPAQS